jgi:hypothetical protein
MVLINAGISFNGNTEHDAPFEAIGTARTSFKVLLEFYEETVLV